MNDYINILPELDITETEITEEQFAKNIRVNRDALLAKSDWTQMSDSPLSADMKQKWAVYRQALRDLPEAYPDLRKLVWPTKPQ
jgi:hypothetical protein